MPLQVAYLEAEQFHQDNSTHFNLLIGLTKIQNEGPFSSLLPLFSPFPMTISTQTRGRPQNVLTPHRKSYKVAKGIMTTPPIPRFRP